MKANMSIEIDDADRNLLANFLDGKQSKRLATRKEVTGICTALFEQHMAAVKEQTEDSVQSKADSSPVQSKAEQASRLSQIDPEDRRILKDKPLAYVRGWNRVKHRAG